MARPRKRPDPVKIPTNAVKAERDDFALLFANAYLSNGCNAERAITELTGETGDVARTRGQQMRLRQDVQQYIEDGRRRAMHLSKVESSSVLRQLVRMVFFDARDIFDERGALLPPSQWPDSIAQSVQSVKVNEFYETTDGERELVGYTKEVKFTSRESAMNMLMRHLGMFERDNKQKSTGNPFEDLPDDVVVALLELIRANRAIDVTPDQS